LRRFSPLVRLSILFLALVTVLVTGFLAPFLVLCRAGGGRVMADLSLSGCEEPVSSCCACPGCELLDVPEESSCCRLDGPDDPSCCDHVALSQPFTRSDSRDPAQLVLFFPARSATQIVGATCDREYRAPSPDLIPFGLASVRSSVLLI
jgi:hypothetical protein